MSVKGKKRGSKSTESKEHSASESDEEFSNELNKLSISNSDEEKDQTDERAEDCPQTPPSSKGTATKGNGNGVRRKLQLKDEESADGKWLPDHPWENAKPDRQTLQIAGTVGTSKVYTVQEVWKSDERNVNLQKIYADLPAFINQMKGPTCRQDLERLLGQLFRSVKQELVTQMLSQVSSTSHLLEIDQEKKGNTPKDEPALRKEGVKFTAYSLEQPTEPLEGYYRYLDCEYMLKMYLPTESLKWFKDESGNRIRTINPNRRDSRWVFIPSFRRAAIALLDWPQEDIAAPKESAIRILVVRPSEFDKYVQCCGSKFPVISLPQDEIGAGYPRFWIQKIALHLKLDFIWMIDDSVECFYEYHPQKAPPGNDYKKNRRRPFTRVFERIEDLVKQAQDGEHPIAAMSPKRFMGARKVEHPFVCSPPRIAVFLSLKALKSKDAIVYYRPELQVFEDMIFGYECEQNGLKVCIDNRIHLQDRDWKDTGARSPSVKQSQSK